MSFSTSMSALDSKWAIFESLKLIEVIKSCLFTNFLLDAIIQDSGIRKRNNTLVLRKKAFLINT